METNSVTVSFSDEKVVKTGDTITVNEISLSIGDIFEDTVEINSVLVKEGRTKTINGIEVYIDTIAYHSHADLPSKAIIKVGTDISQVIGNGDEYTEDDETWIWSIDNLGDVGGYIGVKYDIKSVGFDEDEPENNAISVGEQYVFPENYAAVIFEGLTDVYYEDFDLLFDDRDLYSGNSSTKVDDIDVAILEGESDDSITLTLAGNIPVETDSIYFRYVPGNSSMNASTELYFKDIDGDIDDDHEGRVQLINGASNIKLVVGDTEMDVTFDNSSLTLTNNAESIVISLGVSGTSFKQLGSIEEEAQPSDVVIGTVNIGTREDDVFTHYGTIVRDPENNADSDRVILSVPDEQVFGKVSVKGQGKAVDDEEVPELGGVVIKDTEIASHTDKNLIIVGGSCINAEAAKLLGGHACGVDFTTKTGVAINQYIIQSFVSTYNAEKVAVVVAGYEAADTTKAVADFIASETDFGVGTKVIA